MYKACLTAWGLITYVCAAVVTHRRLENPGGLISQALQKLLIIIIIINYNYNFFSNSKHGTKFAIKRWNDPKFAYEPRDETSVLLLYEILSYLFIYFPHFLPNLPASSQILVSGLTWRVRGGRAAAPSTGFSGQNVRIKYILCVGTHLWITTNLLYPIRNPHVWIKDLRGNPKPRVSPDRTGPDRNRSGVGEHFKEYFRVGSGRGILFRVGPGRGIFYRGMRHFLLGFRG